MDLDRDSLAEKYAEERQKRLRSDGNNQYVEVSGKFAHFADDPYVEPGFSRAPFIEDVDAVVVGGGFSGMIAAIGLRKAGVDNIRVIEKAGDFGGTWYWNRYPGATCDVEAYIYMPMLEEIGYIPTKKYAGGDEILKHCFALAKHFKLYENAVFQTQVAGLRWDEEAARWIVTTDRGDVFRARFVCLASGPLNKQKLPGIPGIEDFEGKSFHTSRWDYDYTGGDHTGNLTGLSDKRVGIIGTGASAIQCIPFLGESAKELYVFQRTATTVDVRANRPTDPAWSQSLEPGWQNKRMVNYDSVVGGIPQPEDMVGDSWSVFWTNLLATAEKRQRESNGTFDFQELMLEADIEKMSQVRDRVEQIVKDTAVAEALKPYYGLFCKRPCFHDEYLPTFNLPNVHLVDTQGKGVTRLTKDAVVVGEDHYPVDCLIFATGFEAAAATYRSGNFAVYGAGGRTLADKWDKGIQSLHGIYSNGFPNLFVVGGVYHAAFSLNFPYVLGEQSTHFAALVKQCLTKNISSIEVSLEAEERWAQVINENAVSREEYFKTCTPSYYNNEGGEYKETVFANVYGRGPVAYADILHSWRETGFDTDMLITTA